MKKLLYLLVAAALLLAFVPAMAVAHTEEEPFVTDLLAGQYMEVGDVEVWNDAEILYVKYEITDAAWCIVETHLQVATSLDGIPQKNGNPIPGKFEENDEHACVMEVQYTYNMAERGWSMDAVLTIAAHAVVADIFGNYAANLDSFASNLPAQVTMSVQYPYSGGPAYFPMTTVTGDPLTGIYEGWCIDTDNVIYQNTTYTANVFSSYESLPGGLVEYPENLDLVNWIINQGFVGQSSGCDGNYTYGDVQRAIWALIEDGQSASGLGAWSECRVEEILAAAGTNGEGFVPECNDYVAVILQPVDGQQVITIAQVTLVDIALGCIPVQYETAWGAGFDFPGKNWATYFTYTVQQPVCPPIAGMSSNIELLGSPPLNVSVGALESDAYVRIWQEFFGPLDHALAYDLEEGRNAKLEGPSGESLEIAAGEYVCIYYVHLDNVESNSTVQKAGYVQFDTDVSGLIISGGNLGTFAGRDLMFAADLDIGYSGTTYPDTSGVNYWRGFDVNYGGNLDDAEFNGGLVDFTMWVVNAHDSLRIILPASWQ